MINPEAERLGIPESHWEAERRSELAEMERRRDAYLGGRRPLPVAGRMIIIVDDGIATGGTVRATLRGLGERGARRIVLAIPVGAADTVESLRQEADEMVFLAAPDPFYSVGRYYEDFSRTSDAEVIELLKKAETEFKTA